MWYYKQSEPGLWTVGHGEGKNWTTDSDHESRESAARRVAYLNGGRSTGETIAEVQGILNEIQELSAISNMKIDDNSLEKLTTIFRKAVQAEVLLNLA